MNCLLFLKHLRGYMKLPATVIGILHPLHSLRGIAAYRNIKVDYSIPFVQKVWVEYQNDFYSHLCNQSRFLELRSIDFHRISITTEQIDGTNEALTKVDFLSPKFTQIGEN